MLLPAAVLALVGPASSGAAPLSWSAPRLVDHVAPFGHSKGLWDVSCPSESLCVGLTVDGVVTSTNPASAAPQWTFAPLPERPRRISCPSVSLCVAVDPLGDVVSSTNPTGGSAAWKAVSITPPGPYGSALTDISCPSPSLCVAVGDSGIGGNDAFVSTDPAGGAGAWTVRNPTAPAAGFYGYVPDSVSCPSTKLCVTTDGDQQVGTLSDPAGAATWNVQHTSATFDRLTCPSSSLCVGAGQADAGSVAVSTDPTGNGDTWRAVSLPGLSRVWSVSCPSESLCLALDDQGRVSYSTDPGDTSTGAWSSPQTVDANAGSVLAPGLFELGVGQFALSCPSTTFCTAVDRFGHAVATTAPTGPADGWEQTIAVGAVDGFEDMSCPSRSLCAAIDDAGRLVTTRTPGDPAAGWNVTTVAGLANGYRWAITCAARPFCLASDVSYVVAREQSQRGFVSAKPDAGADAWRYAGSLAGPYGTATHRLRACPARRVCLGRVFGGYTLTTPTAKRRRRTQTRLIENARTSCPASSFCVSSSFTAQGSIAITHHPLKGAKAWHRVDVEAQLGQGARSDVTAISCPSARLCVAGDAHGDVLVSTRPAKAGSWRLAPVATTGITGLHCPSTSLCVLLAGNGDLFTATRPTGGTSAWQASRPDPTSQIATFACPTDRLCVAGDQDGNVLLGTR
jgi:hypothetical protein